MTDSSGSCEGLRISTRRVRRSAPVGLRSRHVSSSLTALVTLPAVLERYFMIAARGSTPAREIRGLVTFVTMAYIVVLNPLIIAASR
jgi:hypothetical protein